MRFVNLTPTPITIDGLRIAGEQVTSEPRTKPPGADGDFSNGPSRTAASKSAGRSTFQASIALPARRAAACSLPPRPHGVCGIPVGYRGRDHMECAWNCAIPAPK